MSGGSFDYAYNRVESFADDLTSKIAEVSGLIEKHDTYQPFDAEKWSLLKPKLEAAVEQARKTAQMMHDIEWLFSGDNGEDTTLKLAANWPV